LVERHFWPYATRKNYKLFYTLAYDPGLMPTLARWDRMLRAVFNTYASMARKSTPLRKSRANSPSKDAQGRILLDLMSCQAMLEHSGVFVGQLNLDNLQSIFQGVKRDMDEDSELDDDDDEDSAMDDVSSSSSEEAMGASLSVGGSPRKVQMSASERPSALKKHRTSFFDDNDDASEATEAGGTDADERLAFQEFIDVLVAVVMYKDPNPFKPFAERFERFVADSLLVPLMQHWLRVSPDTGLGKTLQVFMAEDQEVQQKPGIRTSTATRTRTRGSGRTPTWSLPTT